MSNDSDYPYRELIDKLESEIQTLYDESPLSPLLRRRLSKMLGYVRDLRALRTLSLEQTTQAPLDYERLTPPADAVHTTDRTTVEPNVRDVAPTPTEQKARARFETNLIPDSPQPGDLWRLDLLGVKTNFHYCPPGAFIMGSPIEEEDSRNNETQHEVTLSQGFWTAETPVTVEAFQAFAIASGYKTLLEKTRGVKVNWKRPGWDDTPPDQALALPVVWITWDDAQEYVAWLNLHVVPSGMTFKLPTEAQWEYACRAGTTTRFSWGEDWDRSKASVYPRGSKPVGSVNYANAWGLKDMHGGVWEWCEDWYEFNLAGPVTDPISLKERAGLGRIIRGGNWECYNHPELLRSAFRNWYGQKSALSNIGFRVILMALKNELP